MIEVEKKFALTEDATDALLKDADFVSEKIFTDVYYDTPSFDLTRKDIWLRARSGKWELKIALSAANTRKSDQYRELETEKEIAEYLNLSLAASLSDALKSARYMSFGSLTTTRKKYKNGDFVIDIDSLDFGYEIAEIELMVSDVSEIDAATEKIISFAKEHSLPWGYTHGKVIEYLKRKAPAHFDVLVKAGVTLS